MEILGAFLGLFCALVFLISLVAMVRPLPRLWMPTRRIALLVFIGSIVGFNVAMVLSPSKPAKTPAVAGKPAVPDAPADQPTKSATEAAARRILLSETRSLWSSLTDAVKPCDEANTRAAESIDQSKGGNVYSGYEAADNAEQACRDAWTALGNLGPPPSATGETKAGFEKALETCQQAYLFRQIALGKMKAVLNGDFRPSAVQEFKANAQTAQIGVLACVAGFMESGSKARMKPGDFK